MIRTFLYSLLFVSYSAYSQTGKITGKIVDAKNGETLPGATILIEGTAKAASADFEGNFSLNNVQAGIVNLIISYISYDTKKITGVEVKANDVTNINIPLDPASSQKDLNEVTVTVELNKENTSALILQQKNNISVSDGVSAEAIKRTPDRSTSDVLKRVSGASIQDNKFAIIRGLNERYNAAYLNGASLPSSESDRKAFSFDIFPSNMLDNLVIIKTARPDMPAEFAGGIIEISTKNIPEKNFFSISTAGGWNTITTRKEQYYYNGGKKDWIGIDDGKRAMSTEIPVFEDFPINAHAQASLAATVPVSDWSLHTKKFSPNYSFQLSTGYNFKLKKDTNNIRDFFGVLFSLTYNRNNNFFTTDRRSYTNNLDPETASDLDRHYFDKTYSEQVLAGSLLNLSCKLNENHVISSKNLFSINSDDRVIMREGSPNPSESNPYLVKSYALWFTSNKIATSQLNGDHYFPKPKIKIGWLGSFSSVNRDVPNLRRQLYTRLTDFSAPTYPISTDTTYQSQIPLSSISNDYGGTSLWTKLHETIKSAKFDISRAFKISEKFKFDIKMGALTQVRNRKFDYRQLAYAKYKVGSVQYLDSLSYVNADQIFSQQNMGLISPGVGGFKLLQDNLPQNPYIAISSLQAGYLMLDTKYSRWFRGVFGARMEKYYQSLTYNDVSYVINKLQRTQDSTVLDVLPSANLIFSLTEKQNIRLSYSQTLNRPEFRELAPFIFYDYNTQFSVSGNIYLKRAKIYNYDIRYEFYPGRSQLISATGFYKNFLNPIEQVASGNIFEVTYKNVDKAKCSGFELEYRVIVGALHKKDSTKFGKFLDRLTAFTNFAYIRSQTQIVAIDGTVIGKRTMQGQSPYVVNGGLTYNDNDRQYSISGIVNRVGSRIYIVGGNITPTIWEQGRTVIDLQATKSFFKKKLELRFNVRDLLAQKLYFYQDKNLNNGKFDKAIDDIMWVTNFGPTYSFQVTLKF